MGDYYWIDADISTLPNEALMVGPCPDGYDFYIGRTVVKNDRWSLTKICPHLKSAKIFENDREYSVDKFQVLCGKRFIWTKTSGGKIFRGAVPIGISSTGEILYVGRVKRGFSVVLGKISTIQKGCLITCSGKEILCSCHEVLVHVDSVRS